MQSWKGSGLDERVDDFPSSVVGALAPGAVSVRIFVLPRDLRDNLLRPGAGEPDARAQGFTVVFVG